MKIEDCELNTADWLMFSLCENANVWKRHEINQNHIRASMVTRIKNVGLQNMKITSAIRNFKRIRELWIKIECPHIKKDGIHEQCTSLWTLNLYTESGFGFENTVNVRIHQDNNTNEQET